MLFFGRVGSSWEYRAFFGSSWGEKVITPYLWFYPLQNKFETYESFAKFKTLAETPFYCKVKKFKSNGGDEFTSLRFQQLLS